MTLTVPPPPLIINVVKMCLHTVHGTKKDPNFSEFVGKKKWFVRVQLANSHNVQMGFEFSGFHVVWWARLLLPAPAYELQHGPSAAQARLG